ncbi:MAG: glycosyltransferase, partial [Candidatus Micrarchaeaceae archaeon]
SDFEVIIISNFDFPVEDVPPGLSLTKIIMDGTLGEFLYEGITRAKNDIIAFLDDDDLWDRNRLKEILEIFTSDSTISYYHNSCRFIDLENRDVLPLVNNPKRFDEVKMKVRAGMKVTPSSISDITKLVNMGAEFNLSSIAVLRRDLIDSLRFLKRIPTAPDIFVFWTIIALGGVVYMDNRRLTSYRIHGKNRSSPYDHRRKAEDLQRIANTPLIIQEYCDQRLEGERKIMIHNLIQLKYLLFLSEYLMFTCSPRRVFLINLRNIIKLGRYLDRITILRILVNSSLYLIHPKAFLLVNKLYSPQKIKGRPIKF